MTKHVGGSVCLYMFFLCVVVCSVSVAVSQTFCVTHWRWSIYIGRFSLVNSFFFYFGVVYHDIVFPFVGVHLLWVHLSFSFFIFSKDLCIARWKKEKRATMSPSLRSIVRSWARLVTHFFVRILPCCDVLALVIVFYSCHHELNCETGSLSSLL